MKTQNAVKNNTTRTSAEWYDLAHNLGAGFSARASKHDLEGGFVFDNYEELRENGFFSAAIPQELGGGGLSHSQMSEVVRIIGTYDGSTALAFSMHQHLIAASVFKYNADGSTEAMLRNVAQNELVLISTGARDWLNSNGSLLRTEGGYLFNGKKHFASQAPAGQIVVTSAPFEEENQVLHFAVPITANGVSVLDDWDVMGMRSTGSQTIVFEDVFVPESAISMRRGMGEFNAGWSVVLTVAMPLIMSAYVGIAQRALEISLEIGSKYQRNQEHFHYVLGEMNNKLIAIHAQWDHMLQLANDLDFKPNHQLVSEILALKTNITDLSAALVKDAMEALGGQSFIKSNDLERLFRDVHAAAFHPLPKWEQLKFNGNLLMEDHLKRTNEISKRD
jgi:alkylation response protein AidB-like acyl-CoA dehydrogenase